MAAREDAPSAAPVAAPPTTERKREAEEWALVLAAEGFEPRVRRGEAGWTIDVAPGREAQASAILTAWRVERDERARTSAALPRYETTSWQMAAAYGLALSLVAFYLGLEAAGRQAAFTDRGDSQAALILAGEPWRTLTALTLHADLAHAAGNALFGGFFLAALAGRLGLGCAVLAFLVSGSLGNLANAVYYGVAHSSIGASTGVFGLVGVLAGLAAWRRHHALPRRRGAWVAFAAGLGIVAMLGGPGPQIDFSGHLFGLGAGALTGVALAYPLAARPRPGLRAQLGASAASLILVLGAWQLA